MQQPIPNSYPPCFRQTPQKPLTGDHFSGDRSLAGKTEQDPLPVIDLRQVDFKMLEEACTNWGIFRLVNHGIPLTLLSELRELSGRVFELGFEEKQILFESIPSSVMSYFWGTPALTPNGDVLYKDNNNKGSLDYNWVEGLNYSISQPSKVDLGSQMLVHDLRILLEEYGVHQTRIAKSIFGAMLQNLKLCEESENEDEGYLSPSSSHLRVYRYPRCLFDNATKVWGMEMHTDSSVVSILNQYEVGGLQILSPNDNDWIDAKPIPNTLLVHLGDMMQAISDDKYKSVKHRVKVNKEKERISIGYFVFPGNDCVIRSSKYKPFTYPDFRAQVQHDIKTLGFKVGLSRFKVNDDF